MTAVANDLEVRMPSSAEKPDPEIAAAVTRAPEWHARCRVTPSPIELKRQIERLQGSAETDAEHLPIRTDGSKVILSGTVRPWAERE